METEVNFLDGYGQRLRGFVVPPATGTYLFWIASDDASSLSISTDEDPANAAPIAYVAGYTNFREWDREPNQLSAPIPLEAGRRYYMEVLHKEGAGGDNLSVRWQLPSGDIEEPITNTVSGTRLIPFRGTIAVPGIYTQPTNLTLLEGRTATFSLLTTNQGTVTYQWQLNGADINDPQARKPALTIPAVNLATHNGQVYRCVLTTPAGSTVSSNATLTVTPDTVPPTIVAAMTAGLGAVAVSFSEALEAASATDPSHYSLSPSAGITGARLQDPQTVILSTASPLLEGTTYTLTVNNVRDLATQPNTIAPNTTVQFIARELNPVDVGSSTPPGTVEKVPGGWVVRGGGASLGGKADQFQFEYQPRVGDFDIGVRVTSFQGVDLWSRAGLMARDSLAPGSRFAGAFASSGQAGCFFESRAVAAGLASSVGSLPANTPYTWLRLRKAGNLVTGFAGYDGVSWSQLGQAILGSSSLLVGLAVESHSTNALATAEFHDFGAVAPPSSVPLTLQREPLGPSTRKTGLVISEIQYKPAPRADTNNTEFIEIYNTTPYFEDLSGYRLAGAVSYTFPEGTLLQGGAFLVVAASPAGMASAYGLQGVMGPYAGTLKSSATLQLLDKVSAVLLEIPYSNLPPWPVGTEGTGHSLVLARPSYGEADPRAWDRSDVVGGSPGGYDRMHPRTSREVRFNELLANPAPGVPGFLELYNHSASTVDLSGCRIVDVTGTNTFTIPAGTLLPALGFASFDAATMGFLPPASGGTVLLWAADGSTVIDGITFEPQATGVATGRWPDGSSEFYPLGTPTPGARNGGIQSSPVVINELMYHPISGNVADEYVELYNPGPQPVDLSDWRFAAGLTFTFPTGTRLQPGAYLVVAQNRTNLFARYPQLSPANTLGDFGGKLPHGGRVALTRPDTWIRSNGHGGFTTNKLHVVVDEVTYETGGRWGAWANGGGSSLELVDAHANRRLASNWGDSDETAKAPWVNIESYGQLDNGPTGSQGATPSLVQVGILDIGECLVDEIEVRPGTNGPNYVRNPSFEDPLNPGLDWQAQGCLVRSSVEAGGYNGGKAMHLRCSDRIWTGANSLQGTLTNTSLGAGKMATLRLKARWLRGWPEVLMRLNGNWVEATGELPVPTNLGTPGLPNSRAVTNAGPAIYEVAHAPSLPAAGQPAVVSARLHDPDGIQSAILYYRIDPSTSYTGVPMTDDGLGGDSHPGDGLFSATVPGQPAGTLVAFYIEARDTAAGVTRFPALRNDNSPVPEGVILFGDATPSSTFGVYHLWVTKDKSTRWGAQPNLSNESWDCTFVYGDRIIYDVLGRFSGSPYHQQFTTPDGALCHYKWTFPDDDKFLGATSFNKIHQPGNGPGDDDTLQREQTGYWLLRQMGLPWNYRRFVAVYVNGGRRGVMMEDTQTPDSDVVKERWPNDSNGYLFKLQPWFEFDAPGVGFDNDSWNTLNNFTTLGGEKKLARYRWNYLMRKTPTSANDYSKVFELVNAANLPTSNPGAYTAALEAVMDTEQYIRTFAVEHSVGNWDSVGNNNGQNMYGYAGQTNRWQLLVWDLNILLASSTGPDGPTGDDLFKLDGANTPLANLVAFPKYKRAYWRAYKELADRWYVATNYSPLMDAKFAALTAEGIGAATPAPIKSYMSARLGYLNSQLASIRTNFTLATNLVWLADGNLATIAGAAPVEAKSILFNGQELPIVWVTPTRWRISFPAPWGTNSFTLQGYDLWGNALTNVSGVVQVVNTNLPPPASGNLVINEIQYNPATPGDSFVELYNRSPNYTYDLSGWRMDGLGYTFPPGSYITNGQYLVLGKDRFAIFSLHGASAVPFDIFSQDLSPEGGSLALVEPGATPDQDTPVSRVRYEARAPWPASANGTGASLQLVDASQDPGRVANWASVERHWQFFSVTTNFNNNRLQLWLDAAADLRIDDLSVVAGTVPGVGGNLVKDADFEGILTTNLGGPWVITGIASAPTALATDAAHSGTNSLALRFASPGSTSVNVFQDLPLAVTNGTYTLSLWYLPNPGASNLVVRLGSGFRTNILAKALLSTPGRSNNVARALAPFPGLWLNEVQGPNAHGVTDNTGHSGPWVELYNGGPVPVDLSGSFLSPDYTRLDPWTFPSGATLNAGEYRIVFADGHPERSTASEWHTSFTLPPGQGSVALSRTLPGEVQILDYLNYDALPAELTYGSFPNGQSFDRMILSAPTPGAPNSAPEPPQHLVINEWMSANSSALLNPTTGKYDDWLEIYNPSPVPSPLSGLYLSSASATPLQYLVPQGYILPPHGHLLVWADKGAGTGNLPGTELHTSFKLSKSGGTLGIYAPDGSPVDVVHYGPQLSNEADGRCPDGAPTLVILASPTPGSANDCSGISLPPTLTPIGDQLVHQGETLRLQVTGTDWNTPPQPLSYSLATGAPPGMTIDGTTGLLVYQVPANAPVQPHLVTVQVTSSANPPLSATASWTLYVLPALRWDGIVVGPKGELSLAFSTTPGRTYRIEYKDVIDDPQWVPLGVDLVATGVTMSIPIDPAGSGRRFYRLVQVN